MDDIYLPEPTDIAEHAIAFAIVMFAHTAFEREVVALQAAITGRDEFGELRANQWPARQRAKKMRDLIEDHRGKIPQTDDIVNLLNDVVAACEQRNLLAHGSWWLFDRKRNVIVVRAGTRWDDPTESPEQREFSVNQIAALAEKLKDVEAELYKQRRDIEAVDKVFDGDSPMPPGAVRLRRGPGAA